MNVVALQPCWYGAKIWKTGEHFVADASDAKVLMLLGKVVEAESAAAVPADAAPRVKRRYRRRDLEAEV